MDFTEEILYWYETNRRDLPWRRTENPYFIWLSEVILQQTRVGQGMAYYLRFVEHYPNIKSLANAPEQEVLKLWQGLGYYSRARNLHFAAKQLMDDHNGTFPDTYAEILTLKGVGEYTAAAVASIAFGEAVPVVDGNVKRVISRIFGLHDTGKKLYDKSKAIMQTALDAEHPGSFNQAVMEFGALQCVPKNPDCELCIFRQKCYAFMEGKVSELPAREIKKKPRKRYFSYFVVHPDEESIILKKRSDQDIWKNLYEFPMIESSKELDTGNLLAEPEFQNWFGKEVSIVEKGDVYKHQLSHQTILARFYKIDLSKNTLKIHPDWKEIPLKKLSEYPVSRLIERYFENGV
jgi:A/G-specific adenine glycosylase